MEDIIQKVDIIQMVDITKTEALEEAYSEKVTLKHVVLILEDNNVAESQKIAAEEELAQVYFLKAAHLIKKLVVVDSSHDLESI